MVNVQRNMHFSTTEAESLDNKENQPQVSYSFADTK